MNTIIVSQPETDGLPPTPMLLAQSRQARRVLAAAIARSEAARTTGGAR